MRERQEELGADFEELIISLREGKRLKELVKTKFFENNIRLSNYYIDKNDIKEVAELTNDFVLKLVAIGNLRSEIKKLLEISLLVHKREYC